MKQDETLLNEVLKDVYEKSRILESSRYMQHGETTVLEHSISVARLSCKLAFLLKIPVDKKKLIRGALLHDYFLYDWHEKDKTHRLHGFRHPKTALKNAQRDFEISDVEKDVILKHMFPLTPVPPKYIESVVVCIADKLCSVYETLYISRLSHL